MNPINSFALQIRHSRAGGNPVVLFNMPLGIVPARQGIIFCRIPACAGMTARMGYLR